LLGNNFRDAKMHQRDNRDDNHGEQQQYASM